MAEDKVIIVTGASQGIGAEVVKEFRRKGYRVVATSRSIKPSGDPDVLTIIGDIADPKTADLVVAEAVAKFGRIDTLVNNAGVFVARPFTDYSAEDYNRVLGTNLAGFFYLTQRAIEHMLKRGSGHVVNITASLADQPSSKLPAVLAALTKGGLNYATTSLAIEYASRGIRVNAVAPGVIKTPMHPEERHALLATLHPVGRIGDVSDIAGAIMYLETAPFVTGEILHVDGGRNVGF
ncbi:SDR family oxidoreductase [Bradyrhizobium sp. AUGA SZCCT0176]|uniref:SDR family NAD(P)-dependent oxidoreductase n=1 Tax=unclassified Bradyrhizobium TaxID=2631580 RepID=UPI001BAA8E67|nr:MULTISPECIES: SDR family oxidoreductase [unclassified Bradyrhizobium]MBR1225171.1 SDR family oxidoreductase [Bradyrhizobium sp. AUGA SZCCT0176]MBR1281262.1 SDR family oxidoreductase [Bradyrhizobium sp. AUGA SZCCT0177]